MYKNKELKRHEEHEWLLILLMHTVAVAPPRYDYNKRAC